LLHSTFVPLAFAAAIFALFAVVFTELRGVKNKGAGLGYAGLFLATALSSGTLTFKQLEDRRLFTLARQHAEQWLESVQEGGLHLPYALTLEIRERPGFELDLTKFYRELQDERRVKFDAYKVLEPELSIRRAGQHCRIAWIENFKRVSHTPLNELFILRYELDWVGRDNTIGELLPGNKDPLKNQPWQVQVTMRRIQALPPLGPQWIMQSIDSLEPKLERKLPDVARIE
jgi:hypothetical protein